MNLNTAIHEKKAVDITIYDLLESFLQCDSGDSRFVFYFILQGFFQTQEQEG